MGCREAVRTSRSAEQKMEEKWSGLDFSCLYVGLKTTVPTGQTCFNDSSKFRVAGQPNPTRSTVQPSFPSDPGRQLLASGICKSGRAVKEKSGFRGNFRGHSQKCISRHRGHAMSKNELYDADRSRSAPAAALRRNRRGWKTAS